MLKVTEKQMLKMNQTVLKGKCKAKLVKPEELKKMYEEVYQVNDKGFFKYKNVYEKAAKMLELFETNRPFEKGNLQTAFLHTLTLLGVNGINLEYTDESLKELIKGLTEKTYTYKDCLEWILLNKKMSKNIDVKFMSLYPDVYQKKVSMHK